MSATSVSQCCVQTRLREGVIAASRGDGEMIAPEAHQSFAQRRLSLRSRPGNAPPSRANRSGAPASGSSQRVLILGLAQLLLLHELGASSLVEGEAANRAESSPRTSWFSSQALGLSLARRSRRLCAQSKAVRCKGAFERHPNSARTQFIKDRSFDFAAPPERW